MESMFFQATSFNQDLGAWDLSSVQALESVDGGFLESTSLSRTNYDRTLIGWAGQSLTDGLTLGVSGTSYCDSEPFRTHIENEFSWTITDAGPDSGCPSALGANGAQNVGSDGQVSLATGVSVDFQGTSGSGRVTAGRFSDAPYNVSGVAEANTSDSRVVIVAGPDLSFNDQTAVRFDASTFGEIDDPSAVTIYSRTTPGNGNFSSLPTSYDATSGEIVAKTGRFSELVFVGNATPPAEVTASGTRSFADASGPQDYRLVALPGQVDAPLSNVVNGENGREWQAYLDDGSSSDFLRRFDGSDTFNFKPGNGFWLTRTSNWTFDLTVPAINLTDGLAEIPLQDGWNIISNPLDIDVDWSKVETENGGTLKPIWAFNGTFGQSSTFASATSGKAYYFLNDQGLNTLEIPYSSNALKSNSALSPTRDNATPKTSGNVLSLTARPAGDRDAPSSTVRVGFHKNAQSGIGPRDVIGPPSSFEMVSLRITPPPTDDAENDRSRTHALMTDRRPLLKQGEGTTFSLHLRDRIEKPVVLSVRNVEAIDQSVSLLRPATGKTYDLTTTKTFRITPAENDGPEQLKLVIGSDDAEGSNSPSEVTLTAYPNPIRNNGTLEYTLPEASDVTLRLYDTLGRQIETLTNGRNRAGRHTVPLDGTSLSSGIYIARLRTKDRTLTQKVIVVR